MYREFTNFFQASEQPAVGDKEAGKKKQTKVVSPLKTVGLGKKESGLVFQSLKLNLSDKVASLQKQPHGKAFHCLTSPKIAPADKDPKDKRSKLKQNLFFQDLGQPSQPFAGNRSVSPVILFSASGKKEESALSKKPEGQNASEQKKHSLQVPFRPDKFKERQASFARVSEQLLDAVKRNDLETVLNLVTKTDPSLYDINIRGENDWTPLHFACWNGNQMIVNLLFYNQGDLNLCGRNSITPSMVCCLKGNAKLMDHLVTLKADTRQRDKNGNTLLHYAARSGSVDCMRVLLQKTDLDLFAKNFEGKAAIDCVKNEEQREILSEYSRRSTEREEERCIKISSVENENFLILNGQKKIVRTDDSSSSRSLDGEEVGPKDFLIHALIGKGSFGEVYLVERKGRKIFYAMKVLYKTKILQQDLIKYAQAERNVLTKMKTHPFIVSLYFAFQTTEKLFLILEYCPGGDMAKLLKEKQRLSEETARIYVAEIVLSLECLHRHNIIYRDLKPDNVVFDIQGHAMLTDFGLSKEDVSGFDRGANSFCGSIAYLAPEMVERKGHGKAVDWYLLGVLLYEMLVGVPPHFATTPKDIFKKISTSLIKFPEHISKEARSLLSALLVKDPAQRLGSSPLGAEEVKQHAFFSGIDWQQVLEKKLVPPKPKITGHIPCMFGEEVFLESNTGHSDDRVENWSFVVDEL